VITAVDSGVLIDLFLPDPRFGPSSRDALRRCAAEGGLVACEVVWAEVAGMFPDPEQAGDVLREIGVRFDPVDEAAAMSAGSAWAAYRRRRGARGRIVADFLIGAHARSRADRLLTRDRGFHRRYFEGLEILDPTAR
jgi:predicted nucleic acid-binding protein